MSSRVAALRYRHWVSQWALSPDQVRERSIRRRVGIAWGLLFLNVIGYAGALVSMPSIIGKMITQGALILALLVALSVNPRISVRPNVFLCLVSLLVIGAIVTVIEPEFLGTIYRTARFVEFAAALWLLSPWWGRRDLLLARSHLASLAVTLASVVVGLLVAPGLALSVGRLQGALWYIPPTQVAHYAAVATGLVVVLWFCGQLRGRVTVAVVVLAVAVLILTRTRTALVGMVAGISVAGLSLISANARVRKLFAVAATAAAAAAVSLSATITAWLVRGENTPQLIDLSGRTLVWNAIVSLPRDKFQEIFGFGLSNSSFNGLSIDSNWFASYQEQGLFGVIVCAAMLLYLLVTAFFQPRGVRRALALFLVTYCLIASITEVGFTDASPYLLDLTVAASLLALPVGSRDPV